MDNIISRITLYHNLYLACIGATVVFLCISIVLFIRLNIKEVIGFLTGSQAKREIQYSDPFCQDSFLINLSLGGKRTFL